MSRKRSAKAYFEFTGLVHAGTKPHHLKAAFRAVNGMPSPLAFPLPWDRAKDEGALGPTELNDYIYFCAKRGYSTNVFYAGERTLREEISSKMPPLVSNDFFRFIGIRIHPRRGPVVDLELLKDTFGEDFSDWDGTLKPWEKQAGSIFAWTVEELKDFLVLSPFDDQFLRFVRKRLEKTKEEWDGQIASPITAVPTTP